MYFAGDGVARRRRGMHEPLGLREGGRQDSEDAFRLRRLAREIAQARDLDGETRLFVGLEARGAIFHAEGGRRCVLLHRPRTGPGGSAPPAPRSGVEELLGLRRPGGGGWIDHPRHEERRRRHSRSGRDERRLARPILRARPRPRRSRRETTAAPGSARASATELVLFFLDDDGVHPTCDSGGRGTTRARHGWRGTTHPVEPKKRVARRRNHRRQTRQTLHRRHHALLDAPRPAFLTRYTTRPSRRTLRRASEKAGRAR